MAHPVIWKIDAVNHSVAAEGLNTAAFAGLREALFLVPGSQVMLTTNVDNVCGLSNGSCGTLLGLVYDGSSRPPDVPGYVVVDMPNYSCVEIYEGHPTWVAISPEENTLEGNR